MEKGTSYLMRGHNQNNIVLICKIVLVPMVQNHRNSDTIWNLLGG